MKIIIETSEALSFNLNGSDLTVLGTIRELLKNSQGYTEKSGKLNFKWLSAKLIFQHLQTAAFKTARQLNNIINKLIRAGLLLKKMFFGKPYFCDIKEQATAATKAQPQQAQQAQPPQPTAAPVVRSKYSANPAPTAEEITDYTTRQGFKGFTVAEFIEYNAARNWAGDWREHAQRWYEKQIKFKQKPLTYNELTNLVCTGRVKQNDYQLNKTDGLWYKKPKSAPAPNVVPAAVPGMVNAAADEEPTPAELENALKEFRANMEKYEKENRPQNMPINERDGFKRSDK
jgi:hypothetical protein